MNENILGFICISDVTDCLILNKYQYGCWAGKHLAGAKIKKIKNTQNSRPVSTTDPMIEDFRPLSISLIQRIPIPKFISK